VLADDLLAERVLVGDPAARVLMVDRIFRPLGEGGGGVLLETASAYLDSGGSLEAAGRSLFVHPNTVRYRLGKIADLTGYDLADPHDAQIVRIALALGRLSTTPSRSLRPAAALPPAL
jgi:DNA-binding PucR family transcriptional regulator